MSDRDAELEHVLPNYRGWLYRVAMSFHRPEMVDDLAQEGYIAMWRALPKYDPAQSHLPNYLTTVALRRMIDVLCRGTWTGKPDSRGSRQVDEVVHVDEWDDPDVLLGSGDALDGVEIAYHDGEIAAALDALSLPQRRYVIARFWLGLDPASRKPEMQAFCDLVPEMRQPWLWTGGTPRDQEAGSCDHPADEKYVKGDGRDRCRACHREQAKASYTTIPIDHHAARQALPTTTSPQAREVLRLRIEHPEASIGELAAMAGMTRNTYANRLRKAIGGGRPREAREPGARERLAAALAHLAPAA